MHSREIFDASSSAGSFILCDSASENESVVISIEDEEERRENAEEDDESLCFSGPESEGDIVTTALPEECENTLKPTGPNEELDVEIFSDGEQMDDSEATSQSAPTFNLPPQSPNEIITILEKIAFRVFMHIKNEATIANPINTMDEEEADDDDDAPTSARRKRPKTWKVVGWTHVKKMEPVILNLVERRRRRKDKTSANSIKTFTFPKKRGKECGSAELAAMLAVMVQIKRALESGKVVTKRDIYYHDPALFGSQKTVDTWIDDLAATLAVTRADLNVAASPKGLLHGPINIDLKNGETLVGNATYNTSIPHSKEIQGVFGNLDFVIVIEKEAVFKTLVHIQTDLRILFITGKGYPDLQTRSFIYHLSQVHVETPILCLVDCDPHGIDILSVYKNGSDSLRHEAERTKVERTRWFGVKSNELTLDKKARALLKRADLEEEWRQELEKMLHTRRKAEIQILSTKENANGVEDYVFKKLRDLHDQRMDDGSSESSKLDDLLEFEIGIDASLEGERQRCNDPLEEDTTEVWKAIETHNDEEMSLV
ncbi:DNA topoisomerase IV, alpha subunit [Atractiella rhizophila]|nr:DNA topoisomerase IV, alpha subunit [Atractiella rhizophila]